ncbi:MAG: nicotinamide riboside transporter PnuC [Gammaproteobacteria bacterium]|nr:nicotinamide riboside transporter PnuC [Gammaproteobacteria bacterium]MDH5591556.1 nicotinamide riboside transporter PnuC [Gammaproteobacteria bacterium]
MESTLLETLVHALSAMSRWEVVAALLGIGYVILAARESQWCWPLAFVSTFIYTVLFWEGQLPMQALLNIYYMGMAVYGYFLWRHHGNSEDDLPISRYSLIQQLIFLVTGTVLTYIVGLYLTNSANSQSPYLDAGVTVFSVLNTWLMAQKILQNWLYWIVIDGAAIVLYAQTGYYATIVMFSLYLVLALIGYLNWQKLYRQQSF